MLYVNGLKGIKMLRMLDLFSGYGGNSLALRDYCKTITYCEIDTYCQGILFNRMENNYVDKAPIWDDIRTFVGKELSIDIIAAGFPCQDISVAGHGKGLEGKRSSLFYEVLRIAEETKVPFIFLENVPAITHKGLNVVLADLAEAGYDAEWFDLRASDVPC